MSKPLRILHLEDETDYSALVKAMLEAKNKLAKTQTDKDKTYYESKCASLDRQIDRLVYDLYGLTEDEINIVEGTIDYGQIKHN